MRLVPLQPPGRMSRKARGYSEEIVQLRAQGYTLDAIREALAAAGVQVSLSTVWREALRSSERSGPQLAGDSGSSAALPQVPSSGPSSRPAPDTVCPQKTPMPPSAPMGISAPAPLAGRTGKDIAEAFRRSQSLNPFIRAKEKS